MKYRILIVEDENIQRHILVGELTERGFHINAAVNGYEALEKLQEGVFDLLITDINMPEMDGIKLMKEVRKIHPDLPIIVTTGYADLDLAIEAINNGVEYLFRKPFGLDDLILKIEHALKKRRLANALLQSAKMASLGELTASVAHELCNALAETNMSGNILKKFPNLDSKQQRYLEIMIAGVDRVSRLIMHLLKFSRCSEKRVQIRLDNLFDTLLMLVDDRIRLQGITVERQFGEIYIEGVVDSLNIIFLNLINNAIQSMGKWGGTLKITASKNGQTVITVSDTGSGIPSEIQDDIFEIFFSTKGEKGNGLGLALAKKEVENMGGEITVESEVGKGTTFSVIFSEDFAD
ncbi:MAG: response regulator [Thermodesulfobacteriota bacterium]